MYLGTLQNAQKRSRTFGAVTRASASERAARGRRRLFDHFGGIIKGITPSIGGNGGGIKSPRNRGGNARGNHGGWGSGNGGGHGNYWPPQPPQPLPANTPSSPTTTPSTQNPNPTLTPNPPGIPPNPQSNQPNTASQPTTGTTPTKASTVTTQLTSIQTTSESLPSNSATDATLNGGPTTTSPNGPNSSSPFGQDPPIPASPNGSSNLNPNSGGAGSTSNGIPNASGATSKGAPVGAIVGTIIGLLALILLLVYGILLYRHRKRRKRTAPSAEFMVNVPYPFGAPSSVTSRRQGSSHSLLSQEPDLVAISGSPSRTPFDHHLSSNTGSR